MGGLGRLVPILHQAIQRFVGAGLRYAQNPCTVRAGYHAVSDFHAAGLGALDLIARATTALRAVQGSGAKGWIRAFDGGSP